MGIEFTMLETIELCKETQSGYEKGLSYTIRSADECIPPNASEAVRAAVTARCEALAALVPQWVEQGKAVWGRPAPQVITGTGG